MIHFLVTGFRVSFSTMNAIVYGTEFFRRSIDEKKIVAVSYLDLSKAFDSIKHEHLKNKLNNWVFSESAIEIVHSFIIKRKLKTVQNKTEFNWISLHHGVSQGTNLNLYIKDLNKILTESCKVVQYADDTFFFGDDKDIKKTLQLLQKSSQSLSLDVTKL